MLAFQFNFHVIHLLYVAIHFMMMLNCVDLSEQIWMTSDEWQDVMSFSFYQNDFEYEMKRNSYNEKWGDGKIDRFTNSMLNISQSDPKCKLKTLLSSSIAIRYCVFRFERKIFEILDLDHTNQLARKLNGKNCQPSENTASSNHNENSISSE